ncbi:hypothetical protein [Bosea sp. TND4EK4]|uniref:hypothetical protein n=1 Tax=Bosea sp. TND4EK4 TaxID=1907408 RepID=UPI0009543518|nr:hypothetical protein [Bosea sp. TND4EK4]SIQ75568.1 hypothetical protein SAMN05880592_105145 [Bosea sp. TND4EK4]
MVEVLKVCRLGPNWAVKDQSGLFWNTDASRAKVEAAAAKMAKTNGARVIARDEQGVKR